jgi:hypothetical protein
MAAVTQFASTIYECDLATRSVHGHRIICKAALPSLTGRNKPSAGVSSASRRRTPSEMSSRRSQVNDELRLAVFAGALLKWHFLAVFGNFSGGLRAVSLAILSPSPGLTGTLSTATNGGSPVAASRSTARVQTLRRKSCQFLTGGLHRVPLTVLSPGPRLAGTPSKGKKCGKRQSARGLLADELRIGTPSPRSKRTDYVFALNSPSYSVRHVRQYVKETAQILSKSFKVPRRSPFARARN